MFKNKLLNFNKKLFQVIRFADTARLIFFVVSCIIIVVCIVTVKNDVYAINTIYMPLSTRMSELVNETTALASVGHTIKHAKTENERQALELRIAKHSSEIDSLREKLTLIIKSENNTLVSTTAVDTMISMAENILEITRKLNTDKRRQLSAENVIRTFEAKFLALYYASIKKIYFLDYNFTSNTSDYYTEILNDIIQIKSEKYASNIPELKNVLERDFAELDDNLKKYNSQPKTKNTLASINSEIKDLISDKVIGAFHDALAIENNLEEELRTIDYYLTIFKRNSVGKLKSINDLINEHHKTYHSWLYIACGSMILFTLAMILLSVGVHKIVYNRLILRLKTLKSEIATSFGSNSSNVTVDGDDEITELQKGIGYFIDAKIKTDEKNLKYILDLEEQKTEMKTLMQSLNEEKDRACAANKAKTEFLANMSHELRTPLNSIIGFSEIMHEGVMGPLPDTYKEYSDIILKSGKHLLSLINQVLDLAKVEADKVSIRKEVFDAKEIVGDIIAISQGYPNANNLHLLQNLCNNDCPICADKGTVKQILLNLISNAIKFTPENGTVELSVELKNDKEVCYIVKDSGIGISKDKIAYIFEPFSQIETSLTRKYDGTGLGLNITKKLIVANGGTIDVESEENKGTKMIVTFPVVTSEADVPNSNENTDTQI